MSGIAFGLAWCFLAENLLSVRFWFSVSSSFELYYQSTSLCHQIRLLSMTISSPSLYQLKASSVLMCFSGSSGLQASTHWPVHRACRFREAVILFWQHPWYLRSQDSTKHSIHNSSFWHVSLYITGLYWTYDCQRHHYQPYFQQCVFLSSNFQVIN